MAAFCFARNREGWQEADAKQAAYNRNEKF